MKNRLLVIFIFFSSVVFGQVESNYKIYSKVIDSFIDNWDSDRDTLTNVVLIEKFIPRENYLLSYYDIFYKSETKEDITYRNWILKYDSSLINLVETESIKECLFNLENNLYNSPLLEKENLSLKTPFTLISSKRFDRFFIFDIQKGWNKFYKKYPKSAGVFMLSRVEYSGNYACIYVEHHGGGLFGSGDILILKHENDNWDILGLINVWIS
ncbi:MAG: hypothetical protein A2W99_07045 [Bacteroidetes bacterium GWF2_33_16]|nr:MAG: hypothetical protein A2X00_12295 [Bacteroidetes bacterium GWE2_32_14]OFY08325.1 MAG: hypothetical protein A2W99_07045 [Bacteroidetes bacterium GWF2_33_16]